MTEHQNVLRIGDVAACAGLTVDAIRYYERMGLLAHDARSSGGFRMYTSDVINRLTFIRQAQALGLRLRDIRELIGGRGRGKPHCERVRTLLIRRLGDVQMQINELRAFRRTLRAALDNCEAALEGDVVDECPVVRSLSPRTKRAKVMA